MGPVSAFAAEARSTRRGYPAFPGAAGFGFAQPNGWGR
jgi:hypothetical protein